MGRGQAFQQWQPERLGEISPTTGQITGTPSSSGTFTVTITAQTTGATGSTTLQWTVVAPDNVTIAPTPAQSSTVGETVNLGIAATDLYENLITWTATGLPAGISMNPRGLKH